MFRNPLRVNVLASFFFNHQWYDKGKEEEEKLGLYSRTCLYDHFYIPSTQLKLVLHLVSPPFPPLSLSAPFICQPAHLKESLYNSGTNSFGCHSEHNPPRATANICTYSTHMHTNAYSRMVQLACILAACLYTHTHTHTTQAHTLQLRILLHSLRCVRINTHTGGCVRLSVHLCKCYMLDGRVGIPAVVLRLQTLENSRSIHK